MGVLFVGHSGTFWGIPPMGHAPTLCLSAGGGEGRQVLGAGFTAEGAEGS